MPKGNDQRTHVLGTGGCRDGTTTTHVQKGSASATVGLGHGSRRPAGVRGKLIRSVVDADDYVIGETPAPIAVVTDNGPCFRGVTFAAAFAGDDPLFRHVRTRVRSSQTNGVVERFFVR